MNHDHFFFSLSILTSVLLAGCQSSPEAAIRGAWQVDSAYLYYNGFETRQYRGGSDWATYQYDEKGTVREIKFDTYRSYDYFFEGDTLYWRGEDGAIWGKYEILTLNKQRMVLKKEKPPVFPGAGQERFEVRYFSRTEAPQRPLAPFRPGEHDTGPVGKR